MSDIDRNEKVALRAAEELFDRLDLPKEERRMTTQEKNKELLRRIMLEGFGEGDLSVIDEIVDPNFTEHQAGLRPGLDSLKGTIVFLRKAIHGLNYTVEDIVADGDRVWARLRARGTHGGKFMGLPPTGKPVEIDVIDICRFENGKMVEHWGIADRQSMLEQLGLLERPRSAA